ncbi:MAG: pyridoxal phosphate-dependent aminotransferase [Chthonomonas sp.]|nr:pyridoxal phosphate-dependent aminotransferase [Chthonomonas sp.]
MQGLNTLTLAQRALALKPSPTLGMTAKARAMKAQGLDVISFAAGEPDFNTPEPICQTAIEALQAGQTKYTASSGTPELKSAIAEKVQLDHGVAVETDQIVVSCGAKHSIYNALMVLVDPGDEVILIAPYWMTYKDQIQLAGGTAVVIYTTPESGFCPTREQLHEAISPRTKAIILNSPSNPTGAMLDAVTLQTVAQLSKQHGFWILSDEIYDHLTYEGAHASVFRPDSDVLDRTILVNGCSKTYAMTGWRIGYCVAPKPIAQAMSNLQDQVTSNPTTFSQAGAVTAMRTPADVVECMRAEFGARRDLGLELLSKIDGVRIVKPKGAFYFFIDVSAHLNPRMPTDVELADWMLEEALIATVPGSVFEGPGHLRLSYATSRAAIEKGLERLAEGLKRLPR